MSLSMENSHSDHSELTENIELLRHTVFFSGLPMEILKVIAYLSVRADYAAGDRIFQQGDEEGRAYLLLSGRLETFVEKSPDRVLREFGKGSLVGGFSLLGPVVRQFSLRAASDITVLTIDRERFMKAIAQYDGHREWMLAAALRLVCAWEEQCVKGLDESCSHCLNAIGLTLL